MFPAVARAGTLECSGPVNLRLQSGVGRRRRDLAASVSEPCRCADLFSLKVTEAARLTSPVTAQLKAPPELAPSGTGKLFLSELKQASGKIAATAGCKS
jgi:hypothetical protein